jgi:maltose/moltooligosaccharide transporter
LLLLSVLVTVFKTKEYPPKEFEEYNSISEEDKMKKESFFKLIRNVPSTMWQLSLVQLFSWFSLYLMWVYSTTAVSQHYFGVPLNFNAETETNPDIRNAFNEAGTWVGMCFAMYSLVAALFSVAMPALIRLTSRKTIYAAALLAGGLGYISTYFFNNHYYILISMAGIGMAWATILALPYTILSGTLPAKRTGVYMGLFNLTVVIPQILSGLLGGPVLKMFFGGQGIYILVMAGISMILGSIAVFFVKEQKAI